MARAKRHFLSGYVWHITHRKSLMRLLSVKSQDDLKIAHRKWIERELENSQLIRQSKWTKSIAVGDESFVRKVKGQLGFRSKGRKIIKEDDDDYQLREGQTGYGDTGYFKFENSFYWDTDHKLAGAHVP